MLSAVHFLLTYKCTYECDHCFLYCGPHADGVFTLDLVNKALAQMKEMESINSAYFEGGEAFIYYPLLLESLRLARDLGLSVGVVSNAYWAVSDADAELWLRPLALIGIADLSISDDIFHNDIEGNSLPKIAVRAAKKLGIPTDSICIEAPKIVSEDKRRGGQPVIGGDVLFKGRAVDKLIDESIPRYDYKRFMECPHEELRNPERIHLDPFGNVHICQGLVIGNINKQPLKELIETYKPEDNPVLGPLISGGPAALAEAFGFNSSGGFISHCHLCFEVRRALLDRFPEILTPKQVYGR